VAVAIPAGADASAMRVMIGERDVTAAFAVRADGRYLGRIVGLALGENVVTARLADGRARASPSPISERRAGVQRPADPAWSCNPGASDALCTRAPSYQYFYVPAGIDRRRRQGSSRTRSTGCLLSELRPGESSAAALIAQTTTDQGHTVPFIVRQETGSVDRGQYQIAVLYDHPRPGTWAIHKPAEPETVSHRRCRMRHLIPEGAAPGVLYAKVLGRGFATMSTSLEATGTIATWLCRPSR